MPMLYTWLHDQQCFTEFPIFSLRLIVLNGRGPPAGNSVAFFTPFGGPGRAGAEGPCEISRLDDDFRRGDDGDGSDGDGSDRITLDTDHDWPICAAAAPPQGDDINCLI